MMIIKYYAFFVGNRMEDFLLEKIDRRRLAKLSNLDYLGLDMVEAGTTIFEVVFIFPSNC